MILYGNPEHSEKNCYWDQFPAEGEGTDLDFRVDGLPWADEYKVNGPPGIADWIFSCVFSVLRDSNGAAQTGAVHTRYTPCPCDVCMAATKPEEYEECERTFSAAKAKPQKRPDRSSRSGAILRPFRLKPRQGVAIPSIQLLRSLTVVHSHAQSSAKPSVLRRRQPVRSAG